MYNFFQIYLLIKLVNWKSSHPVIVVYPQTISAPNRLVWQVHEVKTGPSFIRKLQHWYSWRSISLKSYQSRVWETRKVGGTLPKVWIWMVEALLAPWIKRGSQSIKHSSFLEKPFGSSSMWILSHVLLTSSWSWWGLHTTL